MRSKRTQKPSSVKKARAAPLREASDEAALLRGEDAFTANAGLFRKLFAYAAVGLAITDLDHGFLEVNQVFCSFTGYSEAELKQTSFLEIIQPADRSDARQRLRTLLTGKTSSYIVERKVIRKDGGIVWIQNSVSLIRGDDGRPTNFFTLSQDITERKRAELGQREAERKYRDIFENAVEGIFQTTPAGAFIAANPALAHMLGYESPEELIRERRDVALQGYVDPNGREEFRALLEKQDTVAAFEHQVYRKDGTKIWMSENVRAVRDASGKLQYYEGTIEDITERKLAEEALRQSEREYRGLFENAHDAILILSPEREIVLDVNQRACEMYGLERSEFVGMSLEGISKNPERGRSRIKETLERGTFYNFETTQRRRDGTEMILDINASVVQYKSQTAIQSINRDITDRKRVEEDMFSLRRALELTMTSMAEGVHRVDTQGNIAFENPAAARMLGWDVAELLGKPAHLTMHHTRQDGSNYPKEKCPIYATLRDGIPRHVTDEVFWRQDGTSFPVEYKTAPMRNDRNEIVAAVVTFSDITERTRAEESLQLFRNLIDQSNDAIEVIDPITFRFIDCNESAHRSLGYSREEFLALTVFDIDPLVDPSIIARLDEKMKEPGFATLESLHLRRDGTTFPVEVNVKIVTLERDYRLAVVRDITRRKQADEALRESEERFSKAFNSNPAPLIITRLDDGRFLNVNDAFLLAFEYERVEVIGETVQSLNIYVNPEDRKNLIHKLQEQGSLRGYESQARTKSGRILDLWVSVEPITLKGQQCMLSTAYDITERKRVEEALSKSEERYRELFENAKDAIYVHDLKGRYTSVNRAAEKLLGFAREEILGQHYSNFVAPMDLRYPRENFCKKLDDEAETIYEINLVAKDRRRVHVEVSSRLILENGVPIGVQGTARDITERKRAEDVLRTYSRRLIDAQETERRRIARELHDQVGQMLTALKLNLHAIQGAGNAREVQPLIEDNLKLLDEALEQVRDLSVDLRPPLLDDLGLVTALRWFVDRQARRTGVRAEFTCDSLDPDLRFSPKLETACFRIAQEALTNVIRHAHAKLVTVRLSRNDSRLSLLIKDDGVGFDIDALHDVAAATLGLRGMEERAHAVGGRVKIDSAPDRGTQVFVELPIAMPNGARPKIQKE